MTRPLIHITFFLASLLVFTSCRDTPESLMQELIEKFDEGSEILTEIDQGEDVEKNIERLEEWVEEMNELVPKLKKIEEMEMSEAESEKIEQEYKDKVNVAFKRFMDRAYIACDGKHEKKVAPILERLEIFNM